MKEQNGDWFVGNKLWNVLTPDQRRLILFQRYQHMNSNNNNQNKTTPMPRDQKQNNGYIQNKEGSKIPQNLKVNDSIVKAPIKKEGLQNISRQYNSNNVTNEENNISSIIEEFTNSGPIEEGYGKLCNINMLNTDLNRNEQTHYFNCNNIIQCKAHVEYIARLSLQEDKKSLAIMDSGADIHVFGKGWFPLFEKGPYTPKADLIGFDSVYAKKQGLPIGPHAAPGKTNKGEVIILRAEHGVSNPTANHTLLSTFECREIGIIVDDCHKNHIKSLNGEKGTQSIQFEDNTTIELICKSALMTFNTELLTWDDIENERYPIYEIAIPSWNPKDYFDDPYAFEGTDRHKEIRVNVNLSKEYECMNNEMPPLLDNHLQQEEFSNTPSITKVNQINQIEAFEHGSLAKIQIP